MGADNGPMEELAPSFVRDQLDEILAKEIIALLDVDSNLAMMSFNLASISCVTLIIEREREISQFPDSPPERYSKESFINELIDIGLEKDDAFEKTIDSVISKGYISINDQGDLRSEMPAFMMVGFLDSMFPGMPGMNLVAFVLQMNEEVNSQRKTLGLAKESFTSILKSRGVTVSKDRAEKKASEMVAGNGVGQGQSTGISQKLKKDNFSRLSKLIKKRKQRSSGSSGQFKIKDVFDKGPTKEELEAREAEIKKAEEIERKTAALARELADKEEKIKAAEEAAKKAATQLAEIEQREKRLLEAQKEAAKTEEKIARLEAREALMAEKEAKLKALEERLKQEEEQKLQQDNEAKLKEAREEETKNASRADDDIESKIAAFENDLAMPCPLCKEGEIISKTTEKGKEFFTCTKSDCRFVSWEKPYHFACPLCKNSYLTEAVLPDSGKGLKCPRASCSYTQNNLFDPKQNMVAQAAGSAPKKKKRVVRRRKRR